MQLKTKRSDPARQIFPIVEPEIVSPQKRTGLKLSDTIKLLLKSKDENRVLSVEPDQSVYGAIEKMAEYSVGAMLVISENRSLADIFLCDAVHVSSRVCIQRQAAAVGVLLRLFRLCILALEIS